MKLSNIFEQDPAQAAAMGANALKKTMGANTSGSMVSKALDKLGQGGALGPNLAKALGPYADALEIILSNPQFRNKFMQMMKQAHLSKKEQPAQAPNSKTMNPVPGKQESVTEDQDSVDAVASSITRRIMMQHTELLSKYGPVKVMAAIDDVAEFAGGDGLDEIGSSDVSIWTKQVIQDLEAGHYDRVEEEEQIDELSKGTLGSYVKKAADSTRINTRWAARTGDRDAEDIVDKRRKGINKAVDKLTKEETEQLDEILPQIGAALATRAVGAGASALTRGVASAAGNAVGSMAQSALDDSDEDPTDDASNDGDKVDTVTMDIPLLLRMMEYAREEAHEDMDLHDVAERMIAMSKDGPLSMDDYDSIVGSVEALPAPEEKPMDEGYYAPGPETMPGAVGPQDNTTVSFNQSKTIGDATLNINASAKDMEELHRILKLAGVNYDSDGGKQEPSMQDVAVALEPHAPEAPAEEPCGCQDEEPTNVKYSTDKQTLINVLRDKLQKRLA